MDLDKAQMRYDRAVGNLGKAAGDPGKKAESEFDAAYKELVRAREFYRNHRNSNLPIYL